MQVSEATKSETMAKSGKKYSTTTKIGVLAIILLVFGIIAISSLGKNQSNCYAYSNNGIQTNSNSIIANTASSNCLTPIASNTQTSGINSNNIMIFIIIALLVYLVYNKKKNVKKVKHDYYQIFNDAVTHAFGVQEGLKALEQLDLNETGQPAVEVRRIKGSNPPRVAFFFEDKILGKIGMLCETEYNDGDDPLVEVLSNEITPKTIPEMVRIFERDSASPSPYSNLGALQKELGAKNKLEVLKYLSENGAENEE